MKMATLQIVSGAGILLTASAWAQPIDIDKWKLEQNAAWGFAVALPPSWTVLNMPMAALRLVVRQDLSGGRKLMCQVQANSQPETAAMSQGQLNDYLITKGAPSPQEVATMLTPTGIPATVYSSEVKWVNALPAYIYSYSAEIRSTENSVHQRTLSEWLYIPGRSYGVNCTASSDNANVANQTFMSNLPIFNGFLGSFVIIPQRAN